MNRSLRIGLLLAGVTILSVGIWMSMRPSVRPELVGTWRGTLDVDSTFAFREDGTFTAESIQFLGSKTPVQVRQSGEWKATERSISFKQLSGDTIRDRRKVAFVPTGQWNVTPIKWNDDGTWQPTDVAIGRFKKTN